MSMYLQGHIFRVENPGPLTRRFRMVSPHFGSIPNARKLKSAGYDRVDIQALSQAISHGAMHDSAD